MLIFISTICLPADLTGGHLSRDKPLFVKRFNQARLKERAAFRLSFFFPTAQTVPMWQRLPVKIRAASDTVVAEVLLGLFRTVVFARVRPQQVTHGPERRRLFEPIQLHSERHSERLVRQAVKRNPKILTLRSRVVAQQSPGNSCRDEELFSEIAAVFI